MSRKSRAQEVMRAYEAEDTYNFPKDGVAAALREAVEGLNIEPDPDRELSMEKHYFIKGQNWVKDAILRLANELEDNE